jgi:DNA-binding transcriptional LysR family regulator
MAPDSDRLVVRMERAEIDLAILNLQRAPLGLRSRQVLSERFVVVGRRDHPALKRKLTLESFCALEQVLVSPRGGSFSAQTDEALAAVGRARRVRVSVQGFAPVVDLVAASDLIAVYPERLARRFASRLRIAAPPLSIPGFSMVLAWHERVQHDASHRWLREAVHTALAGAPAARRRRTLNRS